MLQTIVANVLGYLAGKSAVDAVAVTPAAESEGGGFEKQLGQAMSTTTSSGMSPSQISHSIGAAMMGVLNTISNSGDLEERRSMAMLYRQSVIDALNKAGYEASDTAHADKILLDGTTYDILGSLNTPGARVSPQFLEVKPVVDPPVLPSEATRPARDIVFETGYQYQYLLDKANAATTLDERMGYIDQVRDKIVDALVAGGHEAYSFGRHDKIVINGYIYDIFFASKGLGVDTKMQWLRLASAADKGLQPPSGTSTSSTTGVTSAILQAGVSGMHILQQISASSDLGQRRQLATGFQDMLVSALQNMGFTASAHSDADKIVINGVSYDVIRSLNSPGATAQLQVMRLG